MQLPLPKHVSEYTVTSAVADEKDVDGFGTHNIGELASEGATLRSSRAPQKVLWCSCGRPVSRSRGKNAVVVGRSDIVGSPVSYLLKNADATVTVCHSKTVGLQDHLKLADIVVAAIGQPQFIRGEWLKPGAVVIDVGTNYVPDATKKSGQRVVGDVDFESASQVASQISPVPGGVGPMTVAMLLQNVVDSTAMFFERRRTGRSCRCLWTYRAPFHRTSPFPGPSCQSRSHGWPTRRASPPESWSRTAPTRPR